jgi:uncharacterized oxidoreductase
VKLPFIGQADILEHLLDRYHKAQCGDGGAVVLRGEAGIGKSRLIERFLELAGPEGKHVVVTAALDYDLRDATSEIDIDLSGPIRMVMQFLPHLLTQPNGAILNVSSGLAFIPFAISPVYSAAKAGVRAFTRALRVQLKHTNVKVFELAPPVVDTPLNDVFKEDLGGVKLMDVAALGAAAIDGLRNDRFEIRPGLANVMKIMSRVAAEHMLNQLGKSAECMTAAV